VIALALAAGILIGWAARGGAVWSIAEAARYWENECLAAELHIRFERWRRMTPGVTPRGDRARLPVPYRGLTARVLTRPARSTWLWPGHGPA
jgi:hypothetical protein